MAQFDRADQQIFEVIKEMFPGALQKADQAIGFDDSDDTTMDDEDFHRAGFNESVDPIRIVNIKKDVDAIDTTENDHNQDETTIRPIDEHEFGTDGSAANDHINDGMHSNAFGSNSSFDALKLEMAEMQNYKMKLELIKLERELNLKPSKYTKDITRRSWNQRW